MRTLRSSRGPQRPQPPGHGLTLVCGLSGTGPRCRRRVRQGEQSSLYICSCSPSLMLLPEFHLLSDQQQDNKCNTPETSGTAPSPQSMEKLSSTKRAPGTKKDGDRWYVWWVHKALLYSTGDYIHYSVSKPWWNRIWNIPSTNHDGREYETFINKPWWKKIWKRICMCMTKSLCCTVEVNTMLRINYISIKSIIYDVIFLNLYFGSTMC